MAVQDAATLKSYFNTGDVPTEAQFADLIDTIESKGGGGLDETAHDLLDHSGLPGIPSVSGLLNESSHDSLDHSGLLGIPDAYSLPTASTTVLGGVKIDGTTILISDGVISSTGGAGGGVTDHGLLSGLTDDDHPQYHNDARGDARYSQISHNHALANLTEKSYNSLTDKPTIPSITGLLDEPAHDLLDHTGLTGIPAAYSLPTASTTVLGGVKVDGTTVTITDGVISSSATGSASLLVAETVVSGSPVTSVTFSGLDGNAHGGYVLEIIPAYQSSTSYAMKLRFNGSTTDENYSRLYQNYGTLNGGPIQGIDTWAALVSYNADCRQFTSIDIGLVSGYPIAIVSSRYFKVGSNSIDNENLIQRCTENLSNITQIDLISTVPSAIGTGSIFRLYRRK